MVLTEEFLNIIDVGLEEELSTLIKSLFRPF